MCSGWRNVFDRFVFIMPEEELDFYGNLTSFSHFDMVGYNTENINFHNALIFDFSGKKDFKDRLNSARNSIIASPDNIGNIRFLPPVTDAD